VLDDGLTCEFTPLGKRYDDGRMKTPSLPRPPKFTPQNLKPLLLIPTHKDRPVLKYHHAALVAVYARCAATAEYQVNRFRGRGLFVYLTLLVNPALAQVKHGSIGVTYFSQDKIVMAADSRGTVTVGNKQTPNDHECKVGAFGRDAVFNITGFLGYASKGPGDPVTSWRVMDLAHLAARAYPVAAGHLREIAEAWGELIATNTKLLYSKYPKMVTSMAHSQMGVIAVGTFGGFDTSRQLVLFMTEIRLNPSVSVPVTTKTIQAKCAPHNFCASGRIDIFTEFDNITSQRSIDESRMWRPSSLDLGDYDLLRTIRFVELASMFHRGNDIGGPIDAVELQRSGALRWYAQKPNCQQN
jgi:hypothetical protein